MEKILLNFLGEKSSDMKDFMKLFWNEIIRHNYRKNFDEITRKILRNYRNFTM